MSFEWDEHTNQVNIHKHGFDFADAHRLFALPMAVVLNKYAHDTGHQWTGIGMLEGRIVVVSYTESTDKTIRLLSLRKALSHEQACYGSYLKNRLV